MATAVKTFICPVKDKLGWGYLKAFVAIRYASETSQRTYESDDCIADYVEEINSHVISYTVNFWGTEEDKINLGGKNSRPLFDKFFVEAESVCEKDENGEDVYDESGDLVLTGEVIAAHWDFREVFTVDLSHPESEEIQNSNLSDKDEIFSLIKSDLSRKFFAV